MEIEHHVERFGAKASGESQVVANTGPAPRARDDDHLGEVRVAGNDRCGVGFHEVGQAGFRERPLEGPE